MSFTAGVRPRNSKRLNDKETELKRMPSSRDWLQSRRQTTQTALTRLDREAVFGITSSHRHHSTKNWFKFPYAELLAGRYVRHLHCQVFVVLLSIVGCALYIGESYEKFPCGVRVTVLAGHCEGAAGEQLGVIRFLAWLDLVTNLVFMLDYCLYSVYAPTWKAYNLHLTGIADLLSILPVIQLFVKIDYLQCLKALRVSKVVRLTHQPRLRSAFFAGDQVKMDLVALGLSVFGILFITTSWLHALATISPESFTADNLSWHDVLYFVVVTLSTVGYGDISPLSRTARVSVMLFILVIYAYLPPLVSSLIESMMTKEKFRRPYRKKLGVPHVVVGGKTTPRAIKRFLDHYRRSHTRLANMYSNVVFLCPDEPTVRLKASLKSDKYKNIVQYIRGSPWNEADLRMADVASAKSVILLVERGARWANEERAIKMSAIALENFLIRNPPSSSDVKRFGLSTLQLSVLVQTHRMQTKFDVQKMLRAGHGNQGYEASRADTAALPDVRLEHQPSTKQWRQVHRRFQQWQQRTSRLAARQPTTRPPYSVSVMCLDEFKANLITAGVSLPGFVALFTNLTTHCEPPPAASAGDTADTQVWLKQYSDGAQFEVFALEVDGELASMLQGTSWRRLVLQMYSSASLSEDDWQDGGARSQHALLVGMVVDDGRVVVNPADFIVGPSVRTLFVCAQSEQMAELALTVSLVNMDEGRVARGVPAVDVDATAEESEAAWFWQSGRSALSNTSIQTAMPTASPAPPEPISTPAAATVSSDEPAPETPQNAQRKHGRETVNLVDRIRRHIKPVEEFHSMAATELHPALEMMIDSLQAELEKHLFEQQLNDFHITSFSGSDHVIICFPDLHLVDMVALTIRSLLKFNPIHVVILHPDRKAGVEIMSRLLACPDMLARDNPCCALTKPPVINLLSLVHFIRGSSTEDARAWVAAQFASAQAVILLADQDGAEESFEADEPGILVSALLHNAVTIAHTNLDDRVFVLQELVFDSNIHFLRQCSDETQGDQAHCFATTNGCTHWPLFAAGKIFPRQVLETLIVRLSMHNDEAAFWTKFVESSWKNIESVAVPSTVKINGQTKYCRELNSVKVEGGPADFGGPDDRTMRYCDLLLLCLDSGLLPVGLYRTDGTLGSLMPYMLTCPRPDCAIDKDDMLFIVRPESVETAGIGLAEEKDANAPPVATKPRAFGTPPLVEPPV